MPQTLLFPSHVKKKFNVNHSKYCLIFQMFVWDHDISNSDLITEIILNCQVWMQPPVWFDETGCWNSFYRLGSLQPAGNVQTVSSDCNQSSFINFGHSEICKSDLNRMCEAFEIKLRSDFYRCVPIWSPNRIPNSP